MFGFGQLIDILKKNPKKIVFTETESTTMTKKSRSVAGYATTEDPKTLVSLWYTMVHFLRPSRLYMPIRWKTLMR